MSDAQVPAEIIALAESRATARSERDWATADELKGRIEAAGSFMRSGASSLLILPSPSASMSAKFGKPRRCPGRSPS